MSTSVILKKINTAKTIFKNYGTRGIIKGVKNKFQGRAGMYGQGPEGQMLDEINTRGLELFLMQQSEYSQEQIGRALLEMEYKPLISFIMPLYNPGMKWLSIAVESLSGQYYPNWELCVADDGSLDRRGYNYIKRLSEKDSRVRIVRVERNSGIAHASNEAISIAKGEYIAFIDQDDEITKDALFHVAMFLNAHPDSDLIYTDECKIDRERLFDFHCKPDWSPARLLNHMYIGHLSVYRAAVVREAGGLRSEYDFSQDYDLALRVTQTTTRIYHLERILYFWRAIKTSGAGGGKDYARASNLLAVGDWLKRQGLQAIVSPSHYGNKLLLQSEHSPRVSLVIPTDDTDNLISCVKETLEKSSYSNIEFIAVTNSKTAHDVRRQFPYWSCVTFCEYNGEFNFSKKCNLGAQTATGEVLIFLNADVIPASPDWIERILDGLRLPGAGGVSPLLLHSDNTVQYAGMICGTPGLFGTSFNGQPYHQNYDYINPHQLRNVSVLCGACLAVKKSVFFEVGGFNETDTPSGHSDGDLSFRILENGRQCIYTPYSILYHIGNHSWHAGKKKDKSSIYCLKRWGKYLEHDHFFTDSQRFLYYRDFPFRYKIFSGHPEAPDDSAAYKGDVLFVTHDLSLSGAPVVLSTMVALAKEAGYYPVVTSPIDGPLRKEYLAMGVTVIIDEAAALGHWTFENFARNFDLVVVSTLASAKAVEALGDSLPPVLWWIHEGSEGLKVFGEQLPKQIGRNIHPYFGGEYAQKLVSSFNPKFSGPVLNYGVEAIPAKQSSEEKGDRITFLIAGSYERRKGQDVMAEAIRLANRKYSSARGSSLPGACRTKTFTTWFARCAPNRKTLK